jgi:hypothetical protein
LSQALQKKYQDILNAMNMVNKGAVTNFKRWWMETFIGGGKLILQ